MASNKQAFAQRLIRALKDRGFTSARNARSGVDVGPLAKATKVTREMGRRYTGGSALPDADKMQLIADWLNVRVAWLRDGEGPMQPGADHVAEPGATYLTEDAREIAAIWIKLPQERRECFRQLMCLEAVVASHYPWLMFGRPRSESYEDYERRVERDIMRIAARLTKTG